MSPEIKKSCLDCPSYLTVEATVGYFGKSVNAPLCAQTGAVLGKPGATNTDLLRSAEFVAAGCSTYGNPRPLSPGQATVHSVALPDPEARNELPVADQMKTSVRSCTQCVNFVHDTTVASELGFTAGMCRAKGTLIPPNKRVESARGCHFRSFGQDTNSTTTDLLLLPALRDPTVVIVDWVDEFLAASQVEPLDYPTDLEISDEDTQHGIKAWRKISDPDGYGDDVFLPIFDPESFEKDELQYIPKTGDENHPELYIDHGGKLYHLAALFMELDETPTLWGQPGVGKTEVASHMAWMMQAPFYRFPITEATELDELAGRKEYSPEEGTHFVQGRLTKAWPRRSVILIDEPNTGRNEVWTFLRPLIDGQRTLTLDIDQGQMVRRGDHTYLMLAMNPAWSPLNVGTSVIGAADASRLMHVEFTLPPEEVERLIITNRVKLDGWIIDKARLDLVMRISTLLRGLCEDGTLSMTWGVRENIKAARSLKWFGPLVAYSMAGADYLEPQQREAFMDQVRASLPSRAFDRVEPV